MGFEWYASYDDMAPLLKELCPVPAEVTFLVAGCGDSELSEKLVTQLGIKQCISVDFEEEVVARMSARGVPNVNYRTMDVTDMKEMESGTVDFVIDKGTFDALCCDELE